MLSWWVGGHPYKGLITLVLALIAIQYLFGSVENKHWQAIFNSSSISSPHKKRPFNHTTTNSTLLQALMNTTMSATILTMVSVSPDTNTTVSLLKGNLSSEVTTALPQCPPVPPSLVGKLAVVKSPIPSVQDLETRFNWLKPGGHSYPEECKARDRVAIIIPYRDRAEHLLLFLQHMHPMLRRQQLDYTIFVIEQYGKGSFNRAMLMNVGFKEALKMRDFDCFIFHDVDLLPEDDRNLYTCPEQPRHMSVAVDVLNYRLLYSTLFGGVSAITKSQFTELNGFSNSFWGWGGEDDDMSNRIRYHKLHISRYPINIARYTMLQHKKEKPNPKRYENLTQGKKKFNSDGLNDLKYTVKDSRLNLLYTWILADLVKPS